MATPKKSRIPINLALQGGGAHGAFTWGVLDTLIDHDQLEVEAITATSAGAVNAVVFAQGYIEGGADYARHMLADFWFKVSVSAKMSPLQPTIIDRMLGNTTLEFSPSFMALDFLTRIFSPYQFNLFDVNPLRGILDDMIDFEMIRKNKKLKLFINTTQVKSGKIRVFQMPEITLDAVMASACLPFIFKTVEIEGEPYWDGGYTGNPALFPLFYHCAAEDVLLIQINPLYVEEVPTKAPDILDRVNEISFNAGLMSEIRAIQFVKKLLEKDKVSGNEYKDIRLHLIEAGELMAAFGRSSKLNADWDFLQHLRDIGKQAAHDWIGRDFPKVGQKSSVDVEEVFL